MSGTCGILNLDGAPAEPELLRKMASPIAYRGPDGIHCWLSGPVGLLHLALCTTEESFREQQPLANTAETCWIAGDIRIDNRRAVIAALQAKGTPCEEATDAKLMLAAYEAWGLACLERIIGDFAFALWDAGQQRLFCARDQLGGRPLYYCHTARCFVWASEIKAILEHPDISPELNERTVAAYLAIATHGDETFYTGVFQLPRAHYVLVDADGVRLRRYWEVDSHKEICYSSSDEYAEHFLELFKEAVRCRLRSRSPAGVWLSGGRDSASVTCVGAELLKVNSDSGLAPEIQTFTWLCDTLPAADEREFSGAVVEKYDLKAHIVVADGPVGKWPMADDRQVPPDRDTPWEGIFPDVYRALLETADANGVRVILTGVPGDALVGNWNLYYFRDLLKKLKFRAVLEELGHYRRLLNEYRIWDSSGSSQDPYFLRIAQAVLPGRLKWVWQRLQQSQELAYPWINPSFAARVNLTGLQSDLQGGLWHPRRYADPAKQARFVQVFSPAKFTSLVWLERIAARAKVDLRNPWIDPRLVEFVLAIPETEIAQGARSRLLVNRAMRGIMPEVVRHRVGKKFPTALRKLGFEREWANVVGLLEGSLVESQGYVIGHVVRQALEQYRAGNFARKGWVWPVLRFERWLRRYSDTLACVV